MKLNIALCTDENFVVPALVCITSFFENNRNSECVVYLLTEGLTEVSHRKFRSLAEIYGQHVEVKTIDIHRFDDMVIRGRYRVSMYFRFLLAEELAEEDKVLYLDCDTIVRHSLTELFQTDLTDMACAVVVDQQCDDVQIQNRLRISTPYFNSGVMLMNLRYWRKYDTSQTIMRYIVDNPEKCIYPDQDALNIVLGGRVVYLRYTYNYQEMWFTMRDYARFHYSKWSGIDEAGEDPIVVHYCVDDKPWYDECRNPFKDDFIRYATMHDLIGFKSRKRYDRIYYLLDAQIQRLKRWERKFINK